MTYCWQDWHYSPLLKGSSRALTVPSGTQDDDLQSGTDRQGPWRSWELWRPWRPWRCWELWRPWPSWELWRPWRYRELRRPWQCRELRRPWRSWQLWRPWQMVFGALGLGPLGPAPTAGTPTTPPKISLGKSGGIRSPPGLDTQNSTRLDRKALRGQTDRTGQPTGTRSPPGLAWKLRLPLGMTSGALTGSLSNRFHICDKGGRWLEWPPRPQNKEPPATRVSMNKTDMMFKMFLWAQQESAAIRRAWVCGDPAGMSQRQDGRHWVRGGPAGIESEVGGVISRERRARVSRERRRDLPRSAGWRARGQQTLGTRGDPAELPRPLDAG